MEGRKEGGKRNDRNGGRFAAIALPRSYRPAPPDSILLAPHIPMYVYVYTYLLLSRVHTPQDQAHSPTCFSPISSRFSFLYHCRTLSSPSAFGTPPARRGGGKCLVATVWNRHTIHRFLRRLIATRTGIHYTSDFLSISYYGAP